MLGKTDAALAQKLLTFSDAPHLDTKALIQKLDDVAKKVNLDVSTIPAEQMKDPILGTVRSWVRTNTSPDFRPSKIHNLKISNDIVKNLLDFSLNKKDSSSKSVI